MRAYSGESILNETTQGLGERFRVFLIELKAYCCCGTSTTTLDAVSKIKTKHEFHPDDVEEIIVHVSQYFRLNTGDLIYTGTPAGVGPVQIGDMLEGILFLKDGSEQKMFACEVK